jgi:uncharacterized protein YgiM (DUF1202 family)
MPKFSLRTIALTAAAALTVAGIGAGAMATSAQASDTPAASPYAKGKLVKTTTSHWFPTTIATKDTTYKKGQSVDIECKLNGPSVGGNPRWYFLVGGGDDFQFLPARYVKNVGKAPKWCADNLLWKGKVVAKPSLTMRAKPTTSSSAKGTVKYGKKVTIVCKLNGKSVGGNKRWYQLTNGKWVPARYVANVGDVPPYCHR